MMKYNLAIFDMDGTLLDTVADVSDAVNHALKTGGYPEHSYDKIKSFLGDGRRVLMERSLPAGISEAEIVSSIERFNDFYVVHAADKTKPYEGIPELLSDLKKAGVLLAVSSNKPDVNVATLAEQYFSGIFDMAIGEKEPEIRRKPAPDSVLLILEKFGVSKENAVYIGDSEVDLETAKNSGLDCISVSWGFKGRAFLEARGARFIADKAEDIESFFRLF